MEQKKLLEAYGLAAAACTFLHQHTRHMVRDEHRREYRAGEVVSAAPIADLQCHLRPLLPSLSILHTFEADKASTVARVYETLSLTIAQVLAIKDCRITAEGDDSGGGDGADERRAPPPAVSESRPSANKSNLNGEDMRHEEADDEPLPAPAAEPPTAALRWSDIQGCEEAVTALKQATVLPKQFPWLFDGSRGCARRTWQRILLYGPPGTGKTLLAHATACELSDCPFVNLSSADVLSKWVGESEKHIRVAFQQAARHERCLLFLDEMDALCGLRGTQGETEVARRLKTEFLFHLQSLPRSVTVIAATNLPWDLDSAILRRFDAFVYVGLPSPAARRALVERQLRGVDHTLTAGEVAWLVERTEGFSASDVVRLLSHATMAPLRSLVDATRLRLATREEVEDYRHPLQAFVRGRRNREGDARVAHKKPRTAPSSVVSDGSRLTSSTAVSAPALAPPGVSPSCDAAFVAAAQRAGRGVLSRVTLSASRGRHRSLAAATPSGGGGVGIAKAAPTTAGTALPLPPPPPTPDRRLFYVPCPADDPRALLASLTAADVDVDSLLLPRVSFADVQSAVASFIPTVTQADVRKYTKWSCAQQGA